MRHFILGTAGHVDHGKTRLVTRLTGWDTDRLKEEKARGISIELGFAPLKLDDETMIGIVDVPGHERFVKNMVAGAGGIDLAILVIAADEGVMPQTREHLEVLRSLSIGYGVVVITKSDLATDTRPIIKEDISILIENTVLQDAPVIETSVVSGEGIDTLKQTLKQVTQAIPERDRSGPFRLAVDRVFHKQGIGVVVTGSCYSGRVAIGDSLQLLPAEKNVRVREIQSFGEKKNEGHAGERLAMALQGGKLDEVQRGDMLVTPSTFAVSFMVDARIRVAAYADFKLKQRERVRVHHGAREVLGRVHLLECDELGSGDEGLVQLRLEKPIVAGEGDRFVMRKYSPSRVLGGGRIIDPRPRKHRSGDRDVVDALNVIEVGSPEERLIKQLRTSGLAGLTIDRLERPLVQRMVDHGTVIVIDKIAFLPEALRELHDAVHRLSMEYTAKYPLRYGVDKEELRQRVGAGHSTSVFNKMLEWIANSGEIFTRGNLVRAGSRDVELSKDMTRDVADLESLVEGKSFDMARLSELREGWRGRSELVGCLQFLKDAGRIEKVGEDFYIHNKWIDECVQRLHAWFATHSTIAVPQFKELVNVTRKQAIPLLEYLDASRYTARRDNVRIAGPRLGDK